MIYLNSNIINKIGNSNRLYYNGSIVYQGYISKPLVPYENWTVVGDLTVGLWDKDIPMELEDDLYVARNVVFADAEGNGCVFKIRQNGQWDVNFGSYGSYWFLGEEIPLYGYGSNIVVADGIVGEPYTIYFNPTTEMLWVEGDSKEPEGYDFRGRAEAKIYSNYINLNFYDDEEQNELNVRLFTTNTDYIELGEWTNAIGDNYIYSIIFNGQTVGLKDIYFYVDEWDNGDYYIDIDNYLQHFTFLGKIDGIMTPSQANQPEEPDEPETPEIPEGMVSLQYCWDNSIFNMPFRECYIDMNNVEDDASSYYFITLATTPNSEYDSITSYSICPKENSIFDNGNPVGNNWRMYIMEGFYNSGYNSTPVVAIPLGDGIYYYQFAQPVYLSYKPNEVNAPYWRVNVIPLTIEPEIPDTPIIPDAPEGSKELVVTSISKGYVGGGEYEVIFELDDYTTITIDYYNSNPLATGEYTMDNGYSDFGIIKSYTRWDSSLLDSCKSVVTNNGNNNYDFYVEFTLNGATYHFTYNGDL